MIKRTRIVVLMIVVIISIILTGCVNSKGKSEPQSQNWEKWEEVKQFAEKDSEEFDKKITLICDEFGCNISDSYIANNQYVCILYDKDCNVEVDVAINKDDKRQNVFISLNNEINSTDKAVIGLEHMYDLVESLINKLADFDISEGEINAFIQDESNEMRSNLDENIIIAKNFEKNGITFEYILRCDEKVKSSDYKEGEFLEEILILSTY